MLLPHTRSQGFKIVFQHFHGEFLVAWVGASRGGSSSFEVKRLSARCALHKRRAILSLTLIAKARFGGAALCVSEPSDWRL